MKAPPKEMTPSAERGLALARELQPTMPVGWTVTAAQAEPGNVAASVNGPWWDRTCSCGQPGCFGSVFYAAVVEGGEDVAQLRGRLLGRILQVSWPEGVA